MKKHKGLIVMGAVTVIAIAAALIDFKREMDEETRREDETIVLRLNPDQINEIDFTTKDPSSVVVRGQTVVTNQFTLKKTSEGWRFSEPLDELADSDSVYQFIESLKEEKGISLNSTGENPNWSKYGLEKPRGTLIFKDQAGKQLRVDISTKKNFEGAAYLRKDSDNKVLLASPGWAAKAERKIMDFREKRLMKVEPNQIEKFQVVVGKDTFEFVWADGKWKLESQPSWKLDQPRMLKLIESLTGNVISDYYKEGSILPDDRKKFGVSQAEVTIKALSRGHKNFNARIGALNDGGYPVEILDPPMIVKMSAVDGVRLAKLRPETLRDRTQPFEFDKNRVDKIELLADNKALEVTKKDNTWTIVKNEGTKIDVATIPSLIDKLSGLEAAEYLEPSEVFNGKPLRTLQLKDDQGAVVFELELGSSRKRKISGVEKMVYKAQTNSTGGLIAIDEARINELGMDQIFGVKK